jgi:RHS repeat-associated protein
MTAPASVGEQVLAGSGGAGSVSGLGGTFSADPFTGTGRFEVPLPTPPGHGGVEPGLALRYSSGAGGSVCGVGWSFGPPSIGRRTSKGIPEFTDDDVFLMSADELVPIGDDHFMRRTEGAFARIRRVRRGGDDYWAVTDRDGTRRLLGRHASHRDGEPGRIVSWHLSEIRDACDNRVSFSYDHDSGDARAYLERAEWGPYRLELDYEPRPDVLRSARSGVMLEISRRLSEARVQVRHRDTGEFVTFDLLRFDYDQSPITGLSLLAAIHRIGADADGNRRELPPVRFSYAAPRAAPAPVEIAGHAGRSLSDRGLQLVDMSGNGFPDLLESTGSGWLLRSNRGDGGFDSPVPVAGPAVRLADEGVFLSDIEGKGFADLVTAHGWYPNDGAGFGARRTFAVLPAVDLDGPDVRLVDLDGDGIGDVLASDGTSLTWYRSHGGEGWDSPIVRPLAGQELPQLSDRWTRMADTTGDGLADLIRLTRGSIEVHQNLGHGRFAPVRRIPLPERLPADVEPEHLLLADLTGTGGADLVVRRGTRTWIYAGGSGESFMPKVELRTKALGAGGEVQPVDLLGTGPGLLFTEDGDRHAWTLYQPWGATRPDVLLEIDNGMGGITELRYESALAHAARDREAGRPWRYPQPQPVQVVAAISRRDLTTGNRVGTRFAYHEGYHDAAEREFRGFAIVEQVDTETDDVGQGSPPARTVRFYNLGNGDSFADRYTPTPTEPLGDVVPDLPGALRTLRGTLLREEVFSDDGSALSGRPYQVTHSAYTVTPVAGPPDGGEAVFHPALTRRDAILMERTPEARVTSTRVAYDEVGRSVEVRSIAMGRADAGPLPHQRQQSRTHERVTRHSYVERSEPDPDDYDGPYSPAYLIDRLTRAESYELDETGVEHLIGEERRFYDGPHYQGLGHPDSGSEADVIRGLLSCRLQLALTADLLDELFHDAPDGRALLEDEGGYLRIGDRLYIQRDRAAHDQHGNTTSSLDPLGAMSSIEFDEVHALFPARSENAAGYVVEIRRGALPFQIVSWTDQNDNVTDYQYGPGGFLTSVTEKGRLVEGEWEGDPPEHPSELHETDFTLPVSMTTRRRLERGGDLVRQVHYLDGAGRTIEIRTQAEPDPERPMDDRFRVSSRHELDHKGQVVRAFPPVFADTADFAPIPDDGRATTTTYDPLVRPVRVERPDGAFVRFERSPWQTTAWDRDDNAAELDPSNPWYGPYLDQLTHLAGTPVVTHFDALGFAIAAEHLERRTRRAFDHQGEIVSAWDGRGATEPTWRMARDLIGRRLRLGHPASGGDDLQVLNAASESIWTRDGTGQITRVAYDELGRPLLETSDVGQGPLVRQEWRFGRPGDPDHRQIGRLLEVRDAAGARTFDYDWRGNVTATAQRFWLTGAGADDWHESSAALWVDGEQADGPLPGTPLSLDGLDDPTAITETVVYDTRGRPITTQYVGGVEVHESYNETGSPASLSVVPGPDADPIVLIDSYERDAAGRDTAVCYGNGVVARREFDPATDRLAGFTTTGAAGVLADVGLVTAPSGLPLAIVDRSSPSDRTTGIVSATRRFTYDRHSRLIGATGLAHESAMDGLDAVTEPQPEPTKYVEYEVEYEYDAAGNLIRNAEYSPDGLVYDPSRPDRLLGTPDESTSSAYAYDGAGHAVATPRSPLLAHDHRGSLRYAESGGAQVHLRYHDGQKALRVSRAVDGVATLTAWLGGVEYVSVRGPAGSSAHVTVRIGGDAPEGLVRRVLSGPGMGDVEVSSNHPDELGSPTLVTDDSGGLADQESFFPYGRTSDRRADLERPGFLDVDRDPTTGLYLTGPRAYDPTVGRFLQPDPLAAEQPDWSPYAYGLASPMRFTDRSGLQSGMGLAYIVYSTLQKASPTELPPMEEMTLEQWINGAALTAATMIGVPNVANAPTGQSVDERADPLEMTLGIVGQAGFVAPGVSALRGLVSSGSGSVLASTAATPTRTALAASNGTTGQRAHAMLNRFYKWAWRPSYPGTLSRGVSPGQGPGQLVFAEANAATGEVTFYLPAMRQGAAARGMSLTDFFWTRARHEWIHRTGTRIANALGKTSQRVANVRYGGRSVFYEEVIAHTAEDLGGGAAQRVFSNYNLPNFNQAMYANDLRLAAGLGGGAVLTADLLARGFALGGSIGFAGGSAYNYFFAEPPPEPVLPPIKLE